MRISLLGAVASFVLSCVPAHAAWQEASSDHFVIYADDSERDVTTFAQQLEKYHAGMALLSRSELPTLSPSNRVTVYVVRNEREVRALYGDAKSSVAGFYVPRAGGSMAIVPSVQAGNGKIAWSMLVLLHEYAHHFMISTQDAAMPRGMSEGGAEFFASAQFENDGSMWLGRPAVHRAAGLVFVTNVKAVDVLDPPKSTKQTAASVDAFYGKSWLLYHYLNFEPVRKGQFSRYTQLLGAGKTSREAAIEAFGDLEVLERELDRYQVRSRMHALKLSPAMLKIGTVRVRALSPGEAAIKLDPKQVNAYVQKGLALFRQAADAQDAMAGYRAARNAFIALNKLENDHPLPLIYFYRSYAEQGIKPTPLAVRGMVRALELAPFDVGLRMNVGLALLRDGRGADAAVILRPLAYHPHGGAMAEAARKMIERIGKEPTWNGEGMNAVPEDKADEAES